MYALPSTYLEYSINIDRYILNRDRAILVLGSVAHRHARTYIYRV